MLKNLIMEFFELSDKDAKFVLFVTPIIAILFFGLMFFGSTIVYLFS